MNSSYEAPRFRQAIQDAHVGVCTHCECAPGCRSVGRNDFGQGTVPTVINVEIRWDENAGLQRDAIRSQVIDALEAQEIIKENDLLIPCVYSS